MRRYVRDAGDAARRAQRADPLRLHDARRAQGGPAVAGGWTSSRRASTSWPPQEELAAIRPELDGTQVMEHLGIAPRPARRRGAGLPARDPPRRGRDRPRRGGRRASTSGGRSGATASSDRSVRARCATTSTDGPLDPPARRRCGGGCCRSASPPALLVALVVVVLRLDGDRSAGAVAAAVVTAVLAAAAVVVTWLESRRITRHLNRTIERLIDTESELRLLLDDLPEAVLSLDDDGVVRGANAKAAELTGRPVDRPRRPPVRARSSSRRAAPTSTRGWRPGAADAPARRSPFRLPHADGADQHARRGDRRPAPPDRRRRASSACATSPSARSACARSSRPGGGSSRRSTRRRPGMALVRLDDSTILDANRSLADMLDRPGRRARRAQHPRDHPPRGPAGRGRLPGPARARHRRHLPARPALPAQRRRVRVGPHPRRRHRGRGRVAGDHPHRGRHRAAAHGRAAAVGGDPRRPDRACRTAPS